MLPFRLLLASLGGVALLLAFPGHDVWPLAMVGVAALAVATRGTSIRTGLLSGLLLGLCWYTPMFVWASTYAGVPPWLAMSLASALYPAALGGVLAWLQRDGRLRPFAGALAWVVMEWGRSETPFGGFPWARLAFSQADAPVLGLVSWLSVPGLGLVVALCGGLLALAAQRLLGRDRPRSALGILALVTALTWAPLAIPRPTEGEPLDIAGVQADVPEGFTRTLSSDRGEILSRYTDRTTALAGTEPDLVIWPEGSSDLDPLGDSGPEAQARIMDAVEAVDAPVLVGASTRNGEDRLTNTTFVFDPTEGLTDRYDKVYLAPFGEVMPLRPIMRHLSPWVDRMSDFTAGPAVEVLDVPVRDGRTVGLGVGICFEVVVDEAMHDLVAGGAELLVVPTSNAWFGVSDEAVQQLAASRVRAVEHGRAVAHVSNVGVSALITPDGVAHQQSGLFTEALLRGELPLRTQTNPALAVGPWVEPLAAIALVGLCLVPRRRPSGNVQDRAVRLVG